MSSEKEWMDAVKCGILRFRKSEQSGELLCEYANPEAVAMVGHSIGKTWSELGDAYSLPIHFDEEILRLPGERIVKVSKQEFAPLGFIYTLLDISSESRKSKEIEDFLFIASHDLQEPLRKVISFGERMARNKETLGEENSLYLSRMLNATGRMQTMLSGLLSLSRVGQNSSSPTEVDLSEVVKEAFAIASQRANHPQAVRFLPEKLPSIKAVKTQLIQLFEEIFSNSLRFRRSDNAVEIKVESVVDLLQKTVKIRVSDNGIGFASEHAERVFLLFHRLNGRAEFEGAGIGLAICKKIVEKHGGELKAFSAEGKGTTIEIVLPLGSDIIDN
jgi:signal transduction histidine kinase